MNEPFRTLISAAVLAPSGDNMQPWRFEIDEVESSLTVCVDETRDTSPMNAGQRMSRVACGGAIENIAQTAEHNDWEVAIEAHEGGSRIATVHLVRDSSQSGEIPDFIQRRHTNRRPYDGSTLTASITSRWQVTVRTEKDIEIVWVTNRDVLREIAAAIGRADAEMFGRPEFLRAFLSNVRFDLPLCAAADEGLCVGSLELSALERGMLPILRHAPGRLLRSWPIRRSFQAKAEALVTSSSGLCLIVPCKAELGANFRIGRVMQRTWLHLTKAGYQVQPMMSIPVLVNACPQVEGPAASLSKVLRDSAADSFSGLSDRPPAAILRFGRGRTATARTGRRRLDQVTLATHSVAAEDYDAASQGIRMP